MTLAPIIYSCEEEKKYIPAPSLEEITKRFGKDFFEKNESIATLEKIAVIVEPRKHKNLETVVRSVLEKDWTVQIFHGTENKDFIEEIFSKEMTEGKVILTKMFIKNLSLKDYNNMMLSTFFWNEVKGENILMFETDSSFCKSSSTKKMSSFLGYDYVGAPWREGMRCGFEAGTKKPIKVFTYNDFEIQGIPGSSVTAYVGNSGFSYRKKSSYLKILKDYTPRSLHHQNRAYDLFISCAFKHSGEYKIPSLDQAKYFSVEGIYVEKPIAYHKAWGGVDKSSLKKLYKQCPNLREVEKNY